MVCRAYFFSVVQLLPGWGCGVFLCVKVATYNLIRRWFSGEKGSAVFWVLFGLVVEAMA